jgi:dipeptidyl aminopeptidase/acylaminoacyl peptidase
MLFYWMTVIPSLAAEKEISFQTEDGWTIHGMFSAPDNGQGKIPAVLFLHSYEHDSSAYGQYLYPGLAQIIGGQGIATLRFDFRGRGKSSQGRDLSEFSPDEMSKLYLDVRAALAYLHAQTVVDSSKIGIVAEGRSAEAAVRAWAGDSDIKAMILISGRLSDDAKKQIAASPSIPLFAVVSKEDREGFRDMADAYKLTRRAESRISVYKNSGMGTTMFSTWRSEHPQDQPIEDGLAQWMTEQLKAGGQTEEISFQTSDGWTIYGTFWTPSGMSGEAPAPGVVLIHSSFTDRHIFDHLAELMVKQGMAVLNIDTRGRGRSIGKGEFLQLPVEERNNGVLDAKAAVGFLESQPGISRIGLLGTDRGATYALQAAIGAPKVGALVIMTTLLNAKEKEEIAKLDVPIFYLASKDIEIATKALAEAYAVTKNRGSRMLVYNGGALGYDLFELDENLEPTLAQWMKEQLSR